MNGLTVLTLLKVKPSPNGHLHGERPFWAEYGERYLDAWLAGVAKYVPNPKRIVVMIDSLPAVRIPSQLREDRVPLHFIPLDHDVNAPGFWAKLNMFREDVSEGRTLYADLDTTFLGPLDALCALTPDPLVMLDDRNVPGLPNGSVMLFDADRMRGAWDDYVLAPRAFERHYVAVGEDYTLAYDQAFVADWTRTRGFDVPVFQEMLPLGYCLNAFSELPSTDDWRRAHLIFGCGGGKEGKPHTASHQVFRENWASV